jgi:hypothetical protein
MRFALLLVLAVPATVDAQVREVAHLQFYSAFWPNLHHTLYAAAAPADRPLPSPSSGDLTTSMTDTERAEWAGAVAYYAQALSTKDLRAGEGMAEINEVLSSAGDALPAPSILAPGHLAALRAAAPIYRRVLWPAHDRANQAWIRDVAARLDRIAPEVVPRLSRVYGTPWFSKPMRVDITFHGRAYTYGRPVWHSVLASGDPNYATWAGAEMVLHEASHALTDRLSEEIDRQAAGIENNRRDWHLALFYMVGEITRQAIARRGEPYTPYLYAAGVIDRGWPGQRAALETRLRQYVDDETMPMAAGVKAWLAPSPFAFRIGFWNNLHHFLYVLGRARTGSPDSQRAAVVKAPADVEGLASRSETERAAWEESIHYYAAGLSAKDAVFDAGLVEITRKLAAARDNDDPATLDVTPELAATLKLAAPVYRAVWWPRHSRANAARRDDLQAQVEAHGAAGVQRLTALYQTRWSSSPQVINLAAYANWAGAYSTTGGLIVFATLDEAIGGPHGLEILLHESSHQWDDEIDARLTAIARKQGKAVPSLLSHALIFYTSGEIVSELVPGHVPYAVKNGLWNQRGLGAFKPLLDRYWRPYIRGAATFDEAIAAILSRVP